MSNMICTRCGRSMDWSGLDEPCGAVSESTRRFFSITIPMWGGVNLLGHIWAKERVYGEPT